MGAGACSRRTGHLPGKGLPVGGVRRVPRGRGVRSRSVVSMGGGGLLRRALDVRAPPSPGK
jgi:hypothetical protein